MSPEYLAGQFHTKFRSFKLLLYVGLRIKTLVLHPLLPSEREQYYSLRERSHDYQLPERTTQLKDKNFIIRMLYRD